MDVDASPVFSCPGADVVSAHSSAPCAPPPPPPSCDERERVARAALCLVCGQSDPMMNAILLGAPALAVWGALRERADPTDALLALALPDPARRRAFLGASGRRAMWRRHVGSWVGAAARLPDDPAGLADSLTCGGRYRILTPADAVWPRQVNDLALSGQFCDPTCLWVWGDASCLACCGAPLAVVGSREATPYGRRAAGEAAGAAARAGHLVVSGGAMGIDQAAHRAAVDAGGLTVAVMAGGLDHAGPRCNRGLFEDIVSSGGALVSELAPGTVPAASRFLTRNRLIAALSRQTLVAQARHRSGSLNTAATAGLLSRVVTAIPGPVDQPFNAGCNQLIHDGKAILLPDAQGVDEYLDAPHPPRAAPPASRAAPGPAARDEAVLAAIGTARRTGVADPTGVLAALVASGHPMPLPALLARLGALELDGLVTRDAGGGYAVSRAVARDGSPRANGARPAAGV